MKKHSSKTGSHFVDLLSRRNDDILHSLNDAWSKLFIYMMEQEDEYEWQHDWIDVGGES